MKCASVASKRLVAQKRAILALAERAPGKGVEKKIEGEGGTYPGHFAKRAEALDCKRVGENSCFQA
jgi:hypothetical protein